MQQRRWHRATSSVLGVLALTATLSVTATPAAAGPNLKPVVVFPTDDLTVPDPAQLTGRRVALPTEGCPEPVRCGLVRELNELDGFDLDPRIAVRFNRPVDPATAAARITVQEEDGAWRTGVDRVVWDPATTTLYAHPAEQLAPSTTYRLRVDRGPGHGASSETFTTMSATDGLLDLRRQIDSGEAATVAGIEDRGLQVDGVFPVAGTTLSWAKDEGEVDPAPAAQPLALLPPTSTLAFGSFLAPSWLGDDVTIEQTPTRDAGPKPVGAETLPFLAVLPAGSPPPGGWPVAVFGHGFTRSTADLLLAAGANARNGIATIATNVVGHGSGPESAWLVDTAAGRTRLLTHGRGVDQDGDGDIESTEGSSATGDAAPASSRDALRQTAADVMTLVRAVDSTDLDGNGTPDLSGEDVTYFGQSFGGIYGTMLTGVDPTVARSVLNVPGGPISEIARLSPAFRPLTTAALRAAGLLNSDDPTRNFFQEQMPLRGEPPVTVTVAGAVEIQEYLARATWLSRSGSPETFSPLVELERAVFQVAFGDQTVPNPTSYTIIDAGDLWSRTSLYRNDRSPQAALNPHGFLLDPRFAPATQQGQAQVAAFLGDGAVVDPDGPGPVWEVPISDPALLLPLNYPSPATRP
ncbi:Ig-like domain-containing protein [Geodermatophilus chilensis]|uniref:Ig-like domain-containing protein n=1 Tax=Geodermatophilus chilensis TaxID=2035835 RepID=UPI000C26AD5E|nr:Ig-like domain-containing protein [Geodermatophilus chilensis]